MGSAAQNGGFGTPSPPAYVSMEPMRNRLSITKTTTALATSALLVLGLAACGGSGNDEETPAEETTSVEETTDAAEEPTEEETTEDVEAEGDATDICAASTAIQQIGTELSSIDQSDPQAGLDKLDELTATLEAVEPPAEIAADWTTVATTFRSVTDGLSTALADPTAPDAMTKVSEAMTAMTDESFQTSGEAIGTYTAANC